MNKSNYKRMEEIALSLINFEGDKKTHHVSFIIHKGRLVSIATNAEKTHPSNLIHRKISKRTGEDYSEQKKTCSEFAAILKLKRQTNIDTKKCTLVNIRYDRNGDKAIARPCMSCQSLLRYHNFKEIIWSTNNGDYKSNKDFPIEIGIGRHVTEYLETASKNGVKKAAWMAKK